MVDFTEATLGRADGEILEAEWHRAAGDLNQAYAHARRALAYATTPRQPLALLAAHRLLGLLATDAGDQVAAEGHIATALTLADACRAPYERALTLLVRAELALAQGDKPTVVATIDEVTTMCTPIEARLALAHAERIAGRLGQVNESERAPSPFPAGLTAREVEGLRLVAVGMSNSEIAEYLFVSPNTVKVHVARILSKIEARNRTAAADFAQRHGLT